MEIKNLSDVAFIDISGVDKKINGNEQIVRLCNFTNVYNNWAVSKSDIDSFMTASANNNEINRFSLKKGCVAITKDSETRDDIGMSCYIADDLDNTLLGYHCALIIPNKDILNGKYLNVYLNTKTARTYFSNQASGSGQRYTLTIGGIGAVKIPIIPLDEQERIGNIFSYIDRKIVNNNKINSELESMAKALYDYWFLQFEFPNSEGKPYKSSGGKMVYNEQLKKEIPEGWKVVELGAQIFENNKSTIQVNDVENIGKIPFFTSGEEILNCSEKMVSGLNIYMSTGGNASIKIYFGDAAYSTDTWCINAGANTLFYYEYLMTIKQQINGNYFDGSGLKHLKKDAFKKILLYIPKIDIVEKFNQIVEKYFQLISQKTLENKDLTELRDFLLPLLMNGQVTIQEVEKQVEKALPNTWSAEKLLRFNQWVQVQGYAARGDVDEETLKKIFDAMDEDDKK